MAKQPPSHPVQIRVPLDLHKELKRAAEYRGDSLSRTAALALRAALLPDTLPESLREVKGKAGTTRGFNPR